MPPPSLLPLPGSLLRPPYRVPPTSRSPAKRRCEVQYWYMHWIRACCKGGIVALMVLGVGAGTERYTAGCAGLGRTGVGGVWNLSRSHDGSM
ncbi:hypothetical protein BU23DRAFT_165920 [Bimuria novae-zelandiae CBS 107.79]|uniref:Uncharacterized protein n=1 Tax=Bimuria novae-zelandiae CBS 107.79 TaxID=1447943 RepID=A0A6A5V4P8_9PLEO|nr:hypothetical protein BU23DRAFT_165920 [Bimuria novae-zelandiae CBS 107.79]